MAVLCWASTRRNENTPQRLFQCLTVSIRPLRIEELAEVLAVRFNGHQLLHLIRLGIQKAQKKR